MKYLKLFETESEYAEYREDATVFIRPNVSNCEDNPIKVYYNSSTYTPPVINIIRYTASAKLPETTYSNVEGLHTNGFAPIKSHTFADGVGTIEFVYNLTSIGDYTFYGCSGMTSIELPYSLAYIGNSAFRHCSGLTSVEIPSGVTYIGELAFAGCENLTSSIVIPSGVTSIGEQAFYGCMRLTSVVIPNSVTSIDEAAFLYCAGLTSVTIPDSVTSIGGLAFRYCTSLTSVTCESTTPPTLQRSTILPSMLYGTFEDTNNCPIYVPSASVDTYKAATGWSTYASRIQAIP